MKSIEKITEHTLVIKKSEFICTLIPLNDEEKINETIDYYKEKYKDATHNCVAYLVGTKKEPMMMENHQVLQVFQCSMF